MSTRPRRWLLLPSHAFAALADLRVRLYRTGLWKSEALPHPVISVGNLSVGGTGKTPLVAYLAERLLAAGEQPIILSGGYGGALGRTIQVVSDRSRPCSSPQSCGDEPYELARRLPDATIVVGKRRAEAGRAVADRYAKAVYLLDDGFQHLALRRDLDLVVIDLTRPPWRDAVLPAGRLREPLQALARADAALLTRSHLNPEAEAEARAEVARWNPHLPVFGFSHQLKEVTDPTGRRLAAPTDLAGRKAVVLAGIGNPGQFVADLKALGVEITAQCLYRDHHPYTEDDLKRVEARRLDSGAEWILTTAKDAVRLEGLDLPASPVGVLQLETRCADAEAFEALVLQQIAQARRRRSGVDCPG